MKEASDMKRLAIAIFTAAAACGPAPDAAQKDQADVLMCPPDVDARVDKAMAEGLYRLEITPQGAMLYMPDRDVRTLGVTGTDALALVVDCAVAGPDYLVQLTFAAGPGASPTLTYSASDLRSVRQRYTNSLGSPR